MPIHDWTRVDPGVFHDFHNGWIAELRTRLNNGVLPSGYFAISERVAGDVIPDVLTFKTSPPSPPQDTPAGVTLLTETPPQVSISATLESDAYLAMQKAVAIRRSDDEGIIAMIETVASGNKANDRDFRRFVSKCIEALREGYHLLLIDLHPPSPRDPQGIHGAIWSELGGEAYAAPTGKPLTCGRPARAGLCGAARGWRRPSGYASLSSGRFLRQRPAPGELQRCLPGDGAHLS